MTNDIKGKTNVKSIIAPMMLSPSEIAKRRKDIEERKQVLVAKLVVENPVAETPVPVVSEKPTLTEAEELKIKEIKAERRAANAKAKRQKMEEIGADKDTLKKLKIKEIEAERRTANAKAKRELLELGGNKHSKPKPKPAAKPSAQCFPQAQNAYPQNFTINIIVPSALKEAFEAPYVTTSAGAEIAATAHILPTRAADDSLSKALASIKADIAAIAGDFDNYKNS